MILKIRLPYWTENFEVASPKIQENIPLQAFLLAARSSPALTTPAGMHGETNKRSKFKACHLFQQFFGFNTFLHSYSVEKIGTGFTDPLLFLCRFKIR
jgi:hypothetical protein